MQILGMAKSSLGLKGAKASKLELDFFKLLHATASLRAEQRHAIGYLQVLSQAAKDRADGWVEKYASRDLVTVLYTPPTDPELQALAEEKTRNALGLLATNKGKGLSLAALGRQLGEAALVREVFQRHPTATRVTNRREFPLAIDWDFYGIVPLGSSRARQ